MKLTQCGVTLPKTPLAQTRLLPLYLRADNWPATSDLQFEFGCREHIAVSELIRCVEEKVRTQPPPRQGKPGLIQHVAGVPRPSRRIHVGTAAEELHLCCEKGIGNLPLREAQRQSRRTSLHRLLQLGTCGDPPEFVKPVPQIQTELLNGRGAAGDRSGGLRAAEAQAVGFFHGRFSPGFP